jgi:hypothetical protein
MTKSPVTVGIPSDVVVPPVFETVIFCAALDALIVVAGKLNVTGVKTIAAPATAVPLNAAVAWPPATLP